jgi:hypothetical protein
MLKSRAGMPVLGSIWLWRLTGKYLEYSLVKLTVFHFKACLFFSFFSRCPKGENVPLKSGKRRKEGLNCQ